MVATCFIFARGGSKGLPGKNIRDFAGKPLIAWSIKQALEVKRIDRVVVSTDCPEIANIAKKYGADVPFIRPKSLATDDSKEWLSWQHALNALEVSEGILPEVIISLPTTSPLRIVQDIDNCLDEFEREDSDFVITVTEAHRNPYFNMVKKNEDGYLTIVNDSNIEIAGRQFAPVVFDMTTVCYVTRPSFVMNNKSIFDGRVKSVNIPKERSTDIDTIVDFEIAQYLFQKRGQK